MKFRVLAFCALCIALSQSAFAAWTKTQTGVSGSSTSGSTLALTATSFASNLTAGHLCVANLLFADGTTTPPTFSVADENSHTFTNLNTSGSTNMGSAGWIAQAYLIVPSGAGKAITVTYNKFWTASGAAAIWVDEYAPPGGNTVALDNNPTFGSGAAGAINLPTITVATSDDLLVSVASDASDVNGVAGAWVLHDSGEIFGCGSAHILSASANTTVSYNGGGGGNAWNGAGASFKYSASGGATCQPTLRTLGVSQCVD